MQTEDVRRSFLDFFSRKGHKVLESASLIPAQDPSLLFTNAGMVPLKPYFLGESKPENNCCVSSQRCLRVGGKHNDLDNVGYTSRHHTLFEMLGNFSFGAYGKKQAIELAWEFLTEVLHLPKERLWVSVFDKDEESAKIWLDVIGVSKEKLVYIGEKDNFWSMGDTGPCGPCTEIFYDHGEGVEGGPPGSEDEDGDRYVEIWNLVFMQYNRQKDGTLLDLPMSCIDTGMGLERISAVMQGVTNNYDTDIFVRIIKDIEQMSEKKIPSFAKRVIADHMRSICWLLFEQVRPSNEGRGYVLRRVIRRALRFAYTQGCEIPCLYKLVPTIIRSYKGMGLEQNEKIITDVLKIEEEAFASTISQGIVLFEKEISRLNGKVIPGDIVFKLYDTFGFPQDLVDDLAREKGFSVDVDGFEKCMLVQKKRSRENQKFKNDEDNLWDPGISSEFCGYSSLMSESVIKSLYKDGSIVDSVSDGRVLVVLDKTSFYAESGGQIGDSGYILAKDMKFVVEDTRKHNNSIVHYGYCESGKLYVGQKVSTKVDVARELIKKNHSATHLLHAALRDVLGKHVTQKGSLVDGGKLRFDFSHNKSLTDIELVKIEALVNEKIIENLPIDTHLMGLKQAKDQGVMALFTEKYEDDVRVLQMGDFSKELCGGTHCLSTGEIGFFVITSESGIAQGIRRIEAFTAHKAVEYYQLKCRQLSDISSLLKVGTNQVEQKIVSLQDALNDREKTILNMKRSILDKKAVEYSKNIVYNPDNIAYVVDVVEGIDDIKQVRWLVDECSKSIGDSVLVFLCPQKESKCMLMVSVSGSLKNKYSASTFIKTICQDYNFRGGGKSNFAQSQGVVEDVKKFMADLEKRLLTFLAGD